MSALYHYTARSADGAFVTGSLHVDSSELAASHLRTRSLFVTSLEKADTPRGLVSGIIGIGALDALARVTFFRSFSTLLGAGVSMRKALDVTIAQCRNQRLREALLSLAADVEGGDALSEAMSRRPREFPQLTIAMVRAGETGGVLHDVLDQTAELLEKNHALKKRVRAALAYPLVVSLASVALVMFLVANIVPAFAGMFSEMHLDLPITTRMLIAVGQALRQPATWAIGVVIVASTFVFFRAVDRWQGIAQRVDAALFSVPLVGTILRKAALARLARTLGILLRSGVNLASALDGARGVVGAITYERRLLDVAASLRIGEALAGSFERTKLFDPLILQLLRVGEDTGTLDAMLLRAAEYYELDVETAISSLSSLLEPALIVLLGAIVGTIIASILLPLYSIIGSIK